MKNQKQTLETFSAGHFEKGLDYKYFVPTEINRSWIWEDPALNILLEKASIKLGELNSFARLAADIDLFINLHVTKESVVSSRIEGTKTNIDEALLPEVEIKPERKLDWKEVNNYTHALNDTITQLDKLPLSSSLLQQAHKTLMQEIRGALNLPGEFRRSQNWIGGASLTDAVFIPPAPHHVNALMVDLENFLQNKEIHVPALIKVGIAHYQFETIHPFLDGNGRIGRLLITLYLVSEGILEKPLLYLSVFFEKNKSLYYDNLTQVREKNDLLHWLKYFLIGIEETATKGVQTLTAILELKASIEKEIQANAGRRITSALMLMTHLFKNPIVNVKMVEEVCQLSTKAANELVKLFEANKWLVQFNKSIRNRWFIFDPYLMLFA